VPAGHPLRTVEALRATLATGIDARVMHGFYRAYWVEGFQPSLPETMRRVLSAAGYDVDRIVARLDAYRDDLRRRTDEAIALGIFGAPAFVVDGDQLFWGQDRMHFVERALGGWRPSIPGGFETRGSPARQG
jgi:2-hydroxychromene-2-carboxylate isomerase